MLDAGTPLHRADSRPHPELAVRCARPLSRVVESGAEDPGIRCGLSIRCRRSDRPNFGEPPDRVLVVPADGGFPCGRRLRGDVVRAVVEAGGVVRQHQVERARKSGGVSNRNHCMDSK
jgi:hypothetical protein